jgi:hypothetical protein
VVVDGERGGGMRESINVKMQIIISCKKEERLNNKRKTKEERLNKTKEM